MSRYKAFAIHLSLSAVVFVVLLSLILWRWYPLPYFGYDGGWRGVSIIFGVDVVLGPFLTLIVFRTGKRGLKADLSVIALVQLAALTYGVVTVYTQRLEMVVFFNNGLYTLPVSDLPQAGARAAAILKADHHVRPLYVEVPIPPGKAGSYALWSTVFHGLPAPYLQSQLYRPVTFARIAKAGVDVTPLLRTPRNAEVLKGFLHGRPMTDFAFVPLNARFAQVFLAIRKSNDTLAGVLDIDPYPLYSFF